MSKTDKDIIKVLENQNFVLGVLLNELNFHTRMGANIAVYKHCERLIYENNNLIKELNDKNTKL